ncbi:urokinase plasminogen activator surface receptor-like isoform X2 [Toxotes jaculatrix]|uniref:urokinase plasminogen activator surface receptor-like isoform X2 n=1 Tax=Toxotes jaculatrix TaxID=941984 RepID=UPI001B3AB24C|nr:urokinase plasminogen activator surface receptor-like isoform X2 [Toxotes jaculatrix]
MHLLLIFGIVLLPKVYTLRCYECVPGISGQCTDTPKECPSQGYHCGALRVTAYAGGSEITHSNVKSCILPEYCVEGSVNFGVARTVITSKCCTSELCNNQPAPGPSKSIPNGRKCFRCDGQKCTTTLNCEGNEDHCISTVTVEGQKTTMKGCASKQVCSKDQIAQVPSLGSIGAEINCCQGNYCNSASSTTAGLLLLVAPLISLVMFF